MSIKDLAAEANISQGLIYHYFNSKEELLVDVLQKNNPLSEFESITEEIYDLPIQEGLKLLAERLAELIPKKKHILLLITREILSERSNIYAQVISIRIELMSILAIYFQRCIDKGEMKYNQPLIPLHMLISSLLTFSLLDQPLKPVAPQLADIILNGIHS